MKTALATGEAPAPAGSYSQGIVAGDFIFVAGQAGKDPVSGTVVAGGIEAETDQAVRNVEMILAAAGLGLDHVVKSTVHLADMADFAKFDAVYRKFFRPPFPVRTTVGSQLIGILVEIDVVAVGQVNREESTQATIPSEGRSSRKEARRC